MKRHPLALFFVLAFVLPWTIWATTLAEQAGWIGWHVPASLAFWIGLPTAAFGAAALSGGWPAVKDLLLRMVRVRVRPVWYALAVLLTPATCTLAMLVGLRQGWDAGIGVVLPSSALAGTLLVDTWMFLLTEETAWRGFALPRLEGRMPPLAASVVLGAAWALWHLPLFLVAGSFQSSVPFTGFALSTVATSVTIGWIFHGARGSVLVAALFHAVTDVVIAWTGVMTSGPQLFWLVVALQCAVAAAAAAGLRRAPRLAVAVGEDGLSGPSGRPHPTSVRSGRPRTR